MSLDIIGQILSITMTNQKNGIYSDYGIVCPVEFTTTVNQFLILENK
jgi:hypothetical protein